MTRSGRIICALFMGVVLACFWSLSAGAVPISWGVIANTLFDMDGPQQQYIILESRLPRTLLAMLTGGSLAMSGMIVQALLRNPLASPKIIGINSGAALGVCLVVLLLPTVSLRFLPFAAVAGGSLTALAIYAGAELRGASPARLVLVGLAIGFFCDAGVEFILVTAPDAVMSAPLIWLTGSLWSRGWVQVALVWPWLIGAGLIAGALWYRLDLIRLGDTTAMALGVRVRRLRAFLLFLSVVLAAISVSVVGLLGFVGLMAPHIARTLVGGSHKYMMPCTVLTGMFLVVIADATGRALAPPIEISAGILTTIFGAPFFVYVMTRSAKEERV